FQSGKWQRRNSRPGWTSLRLLGCQKEQHCAAHRSCMATVPLGENGGAQWIWDLLQRSCNEHGVVGSTAEQSDIYVIGALQRNAGQSDFPGRSVPRCQRCCRYPYAFWLQPEVSGFSGPTMEPEYSERAYPEHGG